MCHFPIFLCFPECAFSQPSFPNVVDSSLLFPSRSVVADTSFLLAHTSIKRGLFVVDYPRSLPYYTEMCAKIIEWMLKPIQYTWFGGFQPLSMLDTTPGHVSRCVRKQATAQTWWEKVEGLGTVLDGTSPWALRACDWDWEPLYCLCFHCMVLSVGYLKHFRNLIRSCMEETSVKDECGGCWNIYSIIFWIL